jgi:hypothetical protein
MDRVLSLLAEIAKERRERKPLPLHAVSKQTTVGDDAIRKFERAEQGQNIDRMANAYADALGVSVFDLWDEAIRRAKAAASTPTGAGQTALQAKLESERHQQELESGLASRSQRSRPSGTRNAKPKRGSRKK